MNRIAEFLGRHVPGTAGVLDRASNEILTIPKDLATVDEQLKDVGGFRRAAVLAGSLATTNGRKR